MPVGPVVIVGEFQPDPEEHLQILNRTAQVPVGIIVVRRFVIAVFSIGFLLLKGPVRAMYNMVNPAFRIEGRYPLFGETEMIGTKVPAFLRGGIFPYGSSLCSGIFFDILIQF